MWLGVANQSYTPAAIASIAGYTGKIVATGGTFSNGTQTVQPRGFNLDGYETNAMLGNNAPDSSGGTYSFDQASGPNITRLKTWKPNCCRLPVNEASWLGNTVFDATATGSGTTGWHTTALGNLNGTSGAGATYQSNLIAQVAALNAAGCYVILDLHDSMPGRMCPIGQDSMANQDNSIQFWISIANTFGYPNGTALKMNGGTVDNQAVMFDLFNEPYLSSWSLVFNGGFASNQYTNFSSNGALGGYQVVYPYLISATTGTFLAGESFTSTNPSGISGKIMAPVYTNTTTGLASSGTSSIYLRNSSSGTASFTGQGSLIAGTVITGSTSGATATISSATYGFYVAGFAQMLAAVRGAGAQNICLMGTLGYSSDLSQWATYAPADTTAPAGFVGTWTPQIAVSWHPYCDNNCTGVQSATVVSGGSGYAVNDTVTLPIPTTGTYANSVRGLAAVLKVTAVSGGAITSVSPVLNAAIPGSGSNNASGIYCPVGFQSSGVPQASTSGSGSGATFNLTLPTVTNSWVQTANWPNVVALKTTPGVPVCVTEVGDYYSYTETGLTGAPWFSQMASWCDTNNIGMVPWSYNPPYAGVGGSGDYYVIGSDNNPTPGFGATVFNYLSTHAA